MEDAAIIETLTRVKGVGVWTVQMFLMSAPQRPNVLPVGDLGRAHGHEKSLRFGGTAQTTRKWKVDRRAPASMELAVSRVGTRGGASKIRRGVIPAVAGRVSRLGWWRRQPLRP